jgi:hypothetical protein
MQLSVDLLQIRNYLRLINRVYVIHFNVIDSNMICSTSYCDRVIQSFNDLELFLQNLARLR